MHRDWQRALAYVADLRERGAGDGKIRERLTEAGWNPEQAHALLRGEPAPEAVPVALPPAPPPPSTLAPPGAGRRGLGGHGRHLAGHPGHGPYVRSRRRYRSGRMRLACQGSGRRPGAVRRRQRRVLPCRDGLAFGDRSLPAFHRWPALPGRPPPGPAGRRRAAHLLHHERPVQLRAHRSGQPPRGGAALRRPRALRGRGGHGLPPRRNAALRLRWGGIGVGLDALLLKRQPARRQGPPPRAPVLAGSTSRSPMVMWRGVPRRPPGASSNIPRMAPAEAWPM